jgi:flagellar export protein FliJ
MEGKKLKRMLELKRRIEQAKKGEVANARHDRDQAHLALLHAQSEQQQRLAALQGEQEVSVTELADRARFVVLAGHKVGHAREVVAQRDQEVAAREEDRVVATRDVRTFEVLTERDREEQRVIQRGVEQRTADDVNSSRWSPRS